MSQASLFLCWIGVRKPEGFRWLMTTPVYPFLEYGTYALSRKTEYPRAAREKLIKGKVRVIYYIDKKGVPGDYRVLESPSPLLTKAVLDAIDSSFYVPGFCNGDAKEVVHNYTFVFNAFTIQAGKSRGGF